MLQKCFKLPKPIGRSRKVVQKKSHFCLIPLYSLPVVATCVRFRFFSTYVIVTAPAPNETAPSRKVFFINFCTLPCVILKNTAAETAINVLRDLDWRLFKDILRALKERTQGWCFGEEKTSGKAFVDALLHVLFEISLALFLSPSIHMHLFLNASMA